MVRLFVVFVAFLAACDSAGSAGSSCSVTTDCAADLACLEVSQYTGTTCANVGKDCTLSCTTDSDCSTLGDGFTCIQGCGAYKTCGQ